MKRVRTYATVSLFLLTVMAAFAQQNALQSQVLAKERQELDCLRSGNYAEFAGLLPEDAVFVDSHGPAGKAEVLKNTAEFRLNDYTMEDVKFVPLSSKSGLLIHKVMETGTSHGKQFTAKVYISALWTEREGKWLCLYSQRLKRDNLEVYDAS
jgi:hypothetical protein